MSELTPEQRARQQIDAQLMACGWVVQDFKAFDPAAGRGIALREAPLKSGTCDYLLLVDRKAVGVAEAKKQGTLLSGVAEQSGHYAEHLPDFITSMAPGPGKTYLACGFSYRLVKFANARRILFLVDRANLGRQAMAEFQQFAAPDTGRKFTEVYNVQHLTSNNLDPVCRVTICTIQRLYSMLRGEELPEDADEISTYEIGAADGRPKEVAYNPAIPIEMFDFIITDECHRSIYGLWRQVLEYFDAHIIGLTATPSKQTIGFFNQNLVMEYNHERAVADGVNVGYEVYRIKT
jgi:type I restriction enzyme R subunit